MGGWGSYDIIIFIAEAGHHFTGNKISIRDILRNTVSRETCLDTTPHSLALWTLNAHSATRNLTRKLGSTAKKTCLGIGRLLRRRNQQSTWHNANQVSSSITVLRIGSSDD